MTVIRSAQQVVQVLYDGDPALRVSQGVVQVVYEGTPNLNVTQQVAQVVYAPDPSPIRNYKQHVEVVHTGPSVGVKLYKQFVEVLFKVDPLAVKTMTVAFTGYGDVNAQLTIPKLRATITATGSLAGNITGSWNIIAPITAEANVSAELTNFVRMSAAITAEGDITTAGLRKNIKYLDADITATGDVTTAALLVPWHAGSTLNLTQSVSVNIVKNESIQHDLDLQQDVNLNFGQRAVSASNSLVFTHSATVIRVLPVKTASSTLNLTHSVLVYREAISYLNLQHSATGIIYFIPASASSVLNLTHSANAETIINATSSSELNLTHLVDWDQIIPKSVLSNLNLSQHAFAVVLASKKYVLLQAPFGLIQTSVILPNPLLDDNESLVSNLMLRRSMTNVPYTYVQTSKNKRLRYTFILNRMKALELEAFFDSYNGADIKMLNWKGEIWKVKLITNPVDFVQTRRAEPGGDGTDVNLEFEGVLLNG